ncbi:uncharacterized protein LOC115244772 [Formica exsecta]|uniref:uncharacterized protein LOC115244772 n=1 Tax=Formica exsecta TaxID=72781 RepID=UPI001143D755|nr:uncharacterized protein LOC115244772 [Formica exsecta]
MIDILNIGGEPIFDDRIVKIETHTYNPYANTTLEYSDEIRIPIQHQDLYTLPCESFLYVEGKLRVRKVAEGGRVVLRNNCIAFMLDELRYELNGVEIDRNRNVGITSTIKNYVSLTTEKGKILENAAWNMSHNAAEAYFNFCVPLNILLGFCEDYKRVVINARHELFLICSRNDNNCIFGNASTEADIELFKIQWRMPHVILNEINKLFLLRALGSGRYLNMSFRSWDLYEFPLLHNTTKHSWTVKAASQLEKPRYVIFALQIGRKNAVSKDITTFDDCKLTNVKLYLNSKFYPYDDLNLDFDKNRFALLFDMYSRFRESYYGCDNDDVLLNISKFLHCGPLAVIDCSRQNESVKNSTVDVRLEFECKEDIPANTTAYCLILHNRVVEYCPLTNVVRKIT